MIPHTLILTPGLVIHSIYKGTGSWGRPYGSRPSARCHLSLPSPPAGSERPPRVRRRP
jgi:hypothetical protein